MDSPTASPAAGTANGDLGDAYIVVVSPHADIANIHECASVCELRTNNTTAERVPPHRVVHIDRVASALGTGATTTVSTFDGTVQLLARLHDDIRDQADAQRATVLLWLSALREPDEELHVFLDRPEFFLRYRHLSPDGAPEREDWFSLQLEPDGEPPQLAVLLPTTALRNAESRHVQAFLDTVQSVIVNESIREDADRDDEREEEQLAAADHLPGEEDALEGVETESQPTVDELQARVEPFSYTLPPGAEERAPLFYAAQQQLANVIFDRVAAAVRSGSFTGVHFIVLTSNHIEVANQTELRFDDPRLGFTNENGETPHFRVLRYCVSAANRAALEQITNLVENPKVLHVMIADECHYGITAFTGQRGNYTGGNDMFVNHRAFVDGRKRNVVQLMVSATPYNILTRRSRVPLVSDRDTLGIVTRGEHPDPHVISWWEGQLLGMDGVTRDSSAFVLRAFTDGDDWEEEHPLVLTATRGRGSFSLESGPSAHPVVAQAVPYGELERMPAFWFRYSEGTVRLAYGAASARDSELAPVELCTSPSGERALAVVDGTGYGTTKFYLRADLGFGMIALIDSRGSGQTADGPICYLMLGASTADPLRVASAPLSADDQLPPRAHAMMLQPWKSHSYLSLQFFLQSLRSKNEHVRLLRKDTHFASAVERTNGEWLHHSVIAEYLLGMCLFWTRQRFGPDQRAVVQDETAELRWDRTLCTASREFESKYSSLLQHTEGTVMPLSPEVRRVFQQWKESFVVSEVDQFRGIACRVATAYVDTLPAEMRPAAGGRWLDAFMIDRVELGDEGEVQIVDAGVSINAERVRDLVRVLSHDQTRREMRLPHEYLSFGTVVGNEARHVGTENESPTGEEDLNQFIEFTVRVGIVAWGDDALIAPTLRQFAIAVVTAVSRTDELRVRTLVNGAILQTEQLFRILRGDSAPGRGAHPTDLFSGENGSDRRGRRGQMVIVRVRTRAIAGTLWRSVVSAQLRLGMTSDFLAMVDCGGHPMSSHFPETGTFTLDDTNVVATWYRHLHFEALQRGSPCEGAGCDCTEYCAPAHGGDAARRELSVVCTSCNHVHRSVKQYEDLDGLSCLLILVEKGRMGDTFPPSLRAMDLRVQDLSAQGTQQHLSVFEQELGRLCRYTSLTAPENWPYAIIGGNPYDLIVKKLRKGHMQFATMFRSVDKYMRRAEVVTRQCVNRATLAAFDADDGADYRWRDYSPAGSYDEAEPRSLAFNRLVLTAEPQIGKTGTYLAFLKRCRDEILGTGGAGPGASEEERFVLSAPRVLVDRSMPLAQSGAWQHPCALERYPSVSPEHVAGGMYAHTGILLYHEFLSARAQSDPQAVADEIAEHASCIEDWDVAARAANELDRLAAQMRAVHGTDAHGTRARELQLDDSLGEDLRAHDAHYGRYRDDDRRQLHVLFRDTISGHLESTGAIAPAPADGTEASSENQGATWELAMPLQWAQALGGSETSALDALGKFAALRRRAERPARAAARLHELIFVPSIRASDALLNLEQALRFDASIPEAPDRTGDAHRLEAACVVFTRRALFEATCRAWGDRHLVVALPAAMATGARHPTPGLTVRADKHGLGYARLFMQAVAHAIGEETVFMMDDNIVRVMRIDPDGGVGRERLRRSSLAAALLQLSRQARRDARFPADAWVPEDPAVRPPRTAAVAPDEHPGAYSTDNHCGPFSSFAAIGTFRSQQFMHVLHPFREAYVYSLFLLNVGATAEKGVWFRPWPFYEDLRFRDDAVARGLRVVKYSKFVQMKRFKRIAHPSDPAALRLVPQPENHPRAERDYWSLEDAFDLLLWQRLFASRNWSVSVNRDVLDVREESEDADDVREAIGAALHTLSIDQTTQPRVHIICPPGRRLTGGSLRHGTGVAEGNGPPSMFLVPARSSEYLRGVFDFAALFHGGICTYVLRETAGNGVPRDGFVLCAPSEMSAAIELARPTAVEPSSASDLSDGGEEAGLDAPSPRHSNVRPLIQPSQSPLGSPIRRMTLSESPERSVGDGGQPSSPMLTERRDPAVPFGTANEPHAGAASREWARTTAARAADRMQDQSPPSSPAKRPRTIPDSPQLQEEDVPQVQSVPPQGTAEGPREPLRGAAPEAPSGSAPPARAERNDADAPRPRNRRWERIRDEHGLSNRVRAGRVREIAAWIWDNLGLRGRARTLQALLEADTSVLIQALRRRAFVDLKDDLWRLSDGNSHEIVSRLRRLFREYFGGDGGP